MKKIATASIIFLAVAGTSTIPAARGAATIVNNISASASTGGNVVSNGGAVTQGTARASVHIEQNVNGEAQPPIDIATSTATGSIEISVHTQTTAAGTTTHRTSSVNAAMIETKMPPAQIIYAVVPPTASHIEMPPPPQTFMGRIASFFATIWQWVFKSNV